MIAYIIITAAVAAAIGAAITWAAMRNSRSDIEQQLSTELDQVIMLYNSIITTQNLFFQKNLEEKAPELTIWKRRSPRR